MMRISSQLWVLAVTTALLTVPTGCFNIDIGPEEDRSSSPRPAPGSTSNSSRGKELAAEDDGTLLITLPSGIAVDGGGDGGGGGLTEALGQIGKVASSVTMGAEHGALFSAYDTLAFAGQPVPLTVRLQRADNLQGLPGARIGIYQGAEKLGEALTDADGYASLAFTPPRDGDYDLTGMILAVPERRFEDMLNVSAARLLVAARSAKTNIVVVDLDHTVVASGFHHVLLGTATPMAESKAVLDRIAKQYTIVYLTHRPGLLGRRSKGWLRQYGYPRAPVLLSTLRQAVGDSGSFKAGKLAELRKAYPNVKIGIGDKISDARSYADSGIQAYLIPHYKDKPADLRKMAVEIRGLPSTVQVVHDWRQVEAGIFGGKTYPPTPFARWMEARARRRQADDDDD